MWRRPLVSGMLRRLGSATVGPRSKPLERPEPSQRVLGTREGQTRNQSANRAGRGLGESQTGQAQQGRGCGKSSCSHCRHWQDKAGIAEPLWEGKEGDVVCPDFSRACDRVCWGLLRARLVRAGLKGWNMGWVGIWLDNEGQVSPVVQSPLGSHSLVTSLSDQPLAAVEHSSIPSVPGDKMHFQVLCG